MISYPDYACADDSDLGLHFLVEPQLFGDSSAGAELIRVFVRQRATEYQSAIRLVLDTINDASTTPARPAHPAANTDLEWFYDCPDRVASYAGGFVSISNRQVMGHGSELEAYNAAPGALVIYVETPQEAKTATLGL